MSESALEKEMKKRARTLGAMAGRCILYVDHALP
jgi:hypothetical protein